MTGGAEPETQRPPEVRRRRVVIAVVVGVTAVKLWLAAKTVGSNDMLNFRAFAKAIRRFGPIGIYGHRIVNAHGHKFPVYNHPPLIGWMLVGISRLVSLGIPFRFLIRVPASLADIVTVLLVFELVRSRRSLNEATAAAVLVACSPVLIIVSGFHGNTDPVFIMFAFVSFYLLVNDRSAFLAGLAFAAAISVKIVPIVALPVLLLVAARSGRRRLLWFLAGSAAVMAVLWTPVLVQRWTPFVHDVLGFKGYPGKWGIVELATLAGFSKHSIQSLEDSGRSVLLLLSAGVPFLIAWRRRDATIPAFGLSFVLVLLLSTASGARYLVWAVPAAFLINVWAATVYDVAGSVLLIVVYDHWNGGVLPWEWNRARAQGWTHHEVFLAGVAWFALLAVAVVAIAPLPFRRGRGRTAIARREGSSAMPATGFASSSDANAL
jgi:4-amino-4-deoxy-L-arabinose transferase-like glycosyltransferase